MRRSALATAALGLLAAALWHLPGNTLRADEVAPAAATSAAPAITFDQYRAFRVHDIAQRREQLAAQLAAPGLAADEKAVLERRLAYYDRLAAMPQGERDRLFQARFNRIDANHDGKLDPQERAAWRAKQSAFYRELAAERAPTPAADAH
jgi:hypothetical protein